MDINNTTAIITGGASGIGKATVELFLENGSNVVIVDSDQDKLQFVSSLLGRNNKIMYENTDVRNSNQIINTIEKTIKKYNKIDILFNNAGVELNKEIHTLSENEWDYVLDTNLKGTFLCSKYVIPKMIKNGGGVIINNSSQMAKLALTKASSYCASKSAIIGLTKAMAIDLAKYNIRVNAILPGSVDTPLMWTGIDEDQLDIVKKECNDAVPMGRVAQTSEIAKFVLFLVSNQSSYITGACLDIDGGLGAKLATYK